MILATGLVTGLVAGCGGSAPPATRGLWITRWDYVTAADVDRCLDEAARHGFTDVYFQVRGQADAFYRSDLEPWGHQLQGDPGYDPLERALKRARRRGLRLHAWVNVYPLWRGLEPPTAPDHPLHRHPDWRLHDEHGQAQPLNDHYVVANPTDPAVQAHLLAVMRDICARYRIDGLHLDYVRFVSERLDQQRLWPGDPASLARWHAAGGGDGPGRLAHRDWVRQEITQLVSRLSDECRRARPGLEISAAVFRRPALARDAYLQDAVTWLERGLVDRLLPMIYTRDAALFVADLASWREAVPADRLTPGIGVYLHEPAELPPQLEASRGHTGWALFAFESLFESVNPEQDRSEEAIARRRARRAAL